MYCFVILLLFNEMQMSVRRFSAIPHLRETNLLTNFRTWIALIGKMLGKSSSGKAFLCYIK